MSPVPLIYRQRALSRIGEIRCGDEKQNGKVGRKLETFRLTSQHREILDRAAEIYGGTVKQWESPTGQAWQLVTERSTLPVLVIPGYSLRRSYEKWDGPSKRVRVCDGEEEAISGQQCLCNAAGKDECKLLTRLMVLLPETGTSLGWLLSSTGETAADELDLAMRIAEGLAHGRPFVDGELSLTQRKGQLNGQATRFVVPVLGFNPTQPLAAGELPSGSVGTSPLPLPEGSYIPVPSNGDTTGTSLADGLKAADEQKVRRTSRSAAPLPNVDADIEFGAGPIPVDNESGAPNQSPVSADTQTQEPQTLEDHLAALNALVGQLREGGHINTRQLWVKVARMRKKQVDEFIDLYEGKDKDGVLHWSPLRQILRPEEAPELRKALGALWAKTQEEANA